MNASFTAKDLFPDARKLMLRTWRPMAVLTALIWLCGAVICWPVLSFFLRELAIYEDAIVGNYTIYLWLLTPRGILWLLLMGSATLLSWVVYAAGIFLVLNRAAGHGFREGFHIFVREGVGQVTGLLHLSLRAFLFLFPLLLLAALGPGLAYLLFLSHHDINYYLVHQPPELYVAIATGAGWVLLWAVFLLRVIVRFIFVYPCWLDGSGSFGAAFRESWRLTQPVRTPLLRLLFHGVLLWGVVVFALKTLNYLLAAAFLGLFAQSIQSAVYILSGNLILSGFLDATIFFCITAWAASAVFLFYRRVCPSISSQIMKVPETKDLPVSWRFWLKPVSVFLLLISLASWGLSQWFLKQDIPHNPPQVIAHRAGAAHAPENSISGIKQLLNDGVSDWVEIDVQATADGVLVVAHDKDLMKSAEDPRIIGESTYKELRRIDIGNTFDRKFKGERLRPLDDFLKKCDDKLPMMIEFKFSERTNLVEQTIALIRKREMTEQVILMSLELEDVRRVQELAPEIRNGYFVSVEMGNLCNLDVDVIALKDGVVTPEMIETLHALEIDVYVWTVDDPRRMIELMALGVDGLITNDPVLCADIVRRYSKLTAEQRVLIRFRSFWRILKQLDIWEQLPGPASGLLR